MSDADSNTCHSPEPPVEEKWVAGESRLADDSHDNSLSQLEGQGARSASLFADVVPRLQHAPDTSTPGQDTPRSRGAIPLMLSRGDDGRAVLYAPIELDESGTPQLHSLFRHSVDPLLPPSRLGPEVDSGMRMHANFANPPPAYTAE